MWFGEDDGPQLNANDGTVFVLGGDELFQRPVHRGDHGRIRFEWLDVLGRVDHVERAGDV
jgi:hypothetical protein